MLAKSRLMCSHSVENVRNRRPWTVETALNFYWMYLGQTADGWITDKNMKHGLKWIRPFKLVKTKTPVLTVGTLTCFS